MLEGRKSAPRQLLVEKEKPTLNPDACTQWELADLANLTVERVREFGNVYLALALLRRLGLHNLLSEVMDCGQETVGTIKFMDVVVPVRRGDWEVKVRLRTVAKPEEDVAVLLSHLGLRLPSRSKRVQDVVEKNGSNLT